MIRATAGEAISHIIAGVAVVGTGIAGVVNFILIVSGGGAGSYAIAGHEVVGGETQITLVLIALLAI